MARASIPVDLLNPGQVIACLGLLEAARELLDPDVVGGFEWLEAGRARFHVRTRGDVHPIEVILDFLLNAEVRILVPSNREYEIRETYGVKPENFPVTNGFPYEATDNPAILPALLVRGNQRIIIDYWGDSTGRDRFKLWVESGGKPGASFLLDTLKLIRDRKRDVQEMAQSPFDFAAVQSGSFRLDWRRDYVPIDIGFSPNKHKGKQAIIPRGFPWVEVLGAIGLTHARPQGPIDGNRLDYRYGALEGDDIPIAFHRAALGCASLPFSARTFRMLLARPGRDDRCISHVYEEY